MADVGFSWWAGGLWSRSTGLMEVWIGGPVCTRLDGNLAGLACPCAGQPNNATDRPRLIGGVGRRLRRWQDAQATAVQPGGVGQSEQPAPTGSSPRRATALGVHRPQESRRLGGAPAQRCRLGRLTDRAYLCGATKAVAARRMNVRAIGFSRHMKFSAAKNFLGPAILIQTPAKIVRPEQARIRMVTAQILGPQQGIPSLL